MTSGQCADHEQSGANTRVRPSQAQLLCDLDQSGGGALSRCALGLVDLAEHGVCGLGNERSSETSNETGAEVDSGVHAARRSRLVDKVGVDVLGDLLVHDELGHGVWDPSITRESICDRQRRWGRVNSLLEQNRAESSVKRANTLSLVDLAEPTDQAIAECRVADQPNAGSLEWAERDISEELGGGGRCEVDGSAVVGGGLVAKVGDTLLLEELVTTELEGALKEVTSEGRASTCPQSARAGGRDDLAETTDEALVVGDGIELDTGLDAVQVLV